jgi:superfamily II DNA/RNA helicase
LVGATVTESLGNLAVKDAILPEGNSFIATATKFAPLTKESEVVEKDEDSPFLASLRDLNLCLDPGLRHERVIAPGNTGLLCLARLLRQEIRDYEQGSKSKTTEGISDERRKELEMLRKETNEFVDEDIGSRLFKISNEETITENQRPRVVIFFPDEETARNNTSILRDAVWGDHKLGVLLPNTGIGPLEIMEKFKNDELSVLIATPNSIRGLDFPALTHVYTLFLPADDPREYLHLAGRVGRIGQQGSVKGQGGRVTTILDPEEASKYEEMANFLGFAFNDIEPVKVEVTEDSNVEDARRTLEDIITMVDLVPDLEVSGEVSDQFDQEDYDDDDDEDEVDGPIIY